MKIHQFAESLRAQDISVAIALIELIRCADERGAMVRDEWLARVVMAFRRLIGQPLMGGTSEEISPDELSQYLQDHILQRLVS